MPIRLSPMATIRKTTLHLAVLQWITYALPLVTLPWITRALGPAGFGSYSVSLSIVGYFVVITEFGFGLTATRDIAVHRENLGRRSSVFWHTLVAKGLLAGAGGVLLIAIWFLVPNVPSEGRWLALAYVTVLGSALTPVWYFQGLERLPRFTTIAIIVRLAALIPVFVWIRGPGDVDVALAIQAGASLATALLSLADLRGDAALARAHITLSELWRCFRHSWLVFLSTGGISLFSHTNVLVVGAVAGPAEAGVFAAADKLVRAVQGLSAPLSQAAFATVSYQVVHARIEAFALIRRLLLWQGAITLSLATALLLGGPILVRILFGPGFESSIATVRCMAPMIFLVGLSNVLGIQTMLALGLKREFAWILLGAGVVNLIALALLVPVFGALGAGCAVVLTEFLVTVAMAVVLGTQSPEKNPWARANHS